MSQLHSGDALITYDNESETCHIQEKRMYDNGPLLTPSPRPEDTIQGQ